MIVTDLMKNLIDMYSNKILKRKLTLEELTVVLRYNKTRMEFVRNKYYKEMNVIIETAIKELAGDSHED